MLGDDPSSDHALISMAQEYVTSRSRGHANEEHMAAWEKFFCQYDPIIRRFAAFDLGIEELEDCVQEVSAPVRTRVGTLSTQLHI